MEEKVASAEGDSDLRKELLEIYTPLSVAKEEIWRRWNDKELKKKVEEFLGGDIPSSLEKEPSAVLARQLVSPNNELVRYLEIAKKINLKPICLEYLKDKFRAENGDKYYLGKLFFCGGVGKKSNLKTNAVKIINFDEAEGSSLDKVKTLLDENFIDFHHELLCHFDSSLRDIISDQSNWVDNNGKKAHLYYEKFLSLFIYHGVLIENYLIDKHQANFTKEVVLPSYKKVKDRFNIKPLIVNIYPNESEGDLYWRYYPGHLEDFLIKYKQKNAF